MAEESDYDIAIVGGGVAGLYAADRLRKAWQSTEQRNALVRRLNLESDVTLKVLILEENPLELGGRLRSIELPFPGGSVNAELGAMRFTTRHRLVRRLLDDLKIRTVPFEGAGFTTQYYLRGRHFGASEIKRGDKASFPYHLEGTEKGQSPTELLTHVLEQTLRELSLDEGATPETLLVLEKLRGKSSRDRLTHREWSELRKHGLLTGKVRLENIGMWNLLHHYLSPDAAHFVEDGFGYESIIGNWNVSDAIPWFIGDFSPGQVYETVDGSFSHLVALLEKRVTDENAGEGLRFQCKIVRNAHLREVHHASTGSDGMYSLVGSKSCPEYTNLSPAVVFPEEWTGNYSADQAYRAKAVILALPKEPLARLKFNWLDEPAVDTTAATTIRETRKKWRGNLAKVRAHRLAKIALGYRDAWWRTKDIPKGGGGRTFTDLPLRQVYYYDREWLEARGRYKYYGANGDEVDKHGVRATGADVDTAPSANTPREPEIGGLVVAYLDGHHAAFWSFITAVARIHDSDKGPKGTTTEQANWKEEQKRKRFGQRIWAWREPDMLRQLYDQPTKKPWTSEQQALHLYFTRYGLYDRAASKMSHILKDLHSFDTEGAPHVAIPDAVAGAYNFWDDFGDHRTPEAGWHTWEPGVESEKAMDYMAQPFEKREVFVCGEAYSSEQGWIEGALKSVELVMNKLGVMLPGELALNPAERVTSDATLHGDGMAASEGIRDSEGMRDYVGLAPRDPIPKSLRFPDAISLPIAGSHSAIFLSGTIGFDPPWPPESTSIESETKEAVSRLVAKLHEAAGTNGELAVIRVFLKSADDYPRFERKYHEVLEVHGFKPRTIVTVAAPHFGALVALDAIAIETNAKKTAR